MKELAGSHESKMTEEEHRGESLQLRDSKERNKNWWQRKVWLEALIPLAG